MSEAFYSTTVPSMMDTVAISLKKINRKLYQQWSGAGAMPSPFYSSLDASMADSPASSLKKINALIDLGAGGGGGEGAVLSGNGSPEGVVTCTSGACVYVQLDSGPPGAIWSYIGAAGGNTGWG